MDGPQRVAQSRLADLDDAAQSLMAMQLICSKRLLAHLERARAIEMLRGSLSAHLWNAWGAEEQEHAARYICCAPEDPRSNLLRIMRRELLRMHFIWASS